MLTDDGVYMINIIDAFESEEKAKQKAERRIRKEELTTEAAQKAALDRKRLGRRPVRRVPRGLGLDREANLRRERLHLRDRRGSRRRLA